MIIRDQKSSIVVDRIRSNRRNLRRTEAVMFVNYLPTLKATSVD
jgi:hypothetical protein